MDSDSQTPQQGQGKSSDSWERRVFLRRASLIEADWPFISLEDRVRTMKRYPEEVQIHDLSLDDRLVEKWEAELFIEEDGDIWEFDPAEEEVWVRTPEDLERQALTIRAMWIHRPLDKRIEDVKSAPEAIRLAGVDVDDPYEESPYDQDAFPFYPRPRASQ